MMRIRIPKCATREEEEEALVPGGEEHVGEDLTTIRGQSGSRPRPGIGAVLLEMTLCCLWNERENRASIQLCHTCLLCPASPPEHSSGFNSPTLVLLVFELPCTLVIPFRALFQSLLMLYKY
ncbi:hypothetical protein E2C01_065425 [Portunus trituberculatus]|uniref:Uncharacterized protein n=1 Tax=Portunus trituberculatus TaxID=210409 RepID=A0A5B7HNC6_PORTR|nr:hypothetical protein [Portunus trituberculatus]